MICDSCEQEPCTCKKKTPQHRTQRSWLSPKTKVRYYLCDWSDGCNLPCRTNPDGGDQLCRWHAECARGGADARNYDQFAAFLVNMQTAYPSQGWWSWSPQRLWPILHGQAEVST